MSTLFQAVQGSLGVSITPSHFYFPVPNFRSIRSKDWNACRPCSAVDFRFQEQIEMLYRDLLPFSSEWGFPEHATADRSRFHFNNGFFERIDAEVAYSIVRHRKPRRIVEIGSGNTTLVLASALCKNQSEGFPGELTSIEPYPPVFLKSCVPGLTRLVTSPVQKVSLELFRSLRANDILFIDSSHVVSMDSDVLYEFLHILPELASGVLVHFHDIFTPLDYPEKFVKTNLCFWSEQYLLEAFLSFNSSFRVVWSSSAMQQFHPEVLRTAFPAWDGSFVRMPPRLRVFAPSLDNNRVWPCSFWVQRIVTGDSARPGISHSSVSRWLPKQE
ncbi:MAG: class I SAM-dependent methyltransferase [Acidobacteria bacterium]|nr:class I SAM-dependent methyltransferase [Acidobacteriota bacterium]